MIKLFFYRIHLARLQGFDLRESFNHAKREYKRDKIFNSK